MGSEKRCWGWQDFRRCKRRGPWRWFCQDHARQPWHWLFVVLFTIGPALGTYYSCSRNEALPEAALKLAREHAVTEAALRGFFREMDIEAVSPEDLDRQLQDFAREYQRLKQVLENLEGRGEDVAAQVAKVREALERGDLETARTRLGVLREARAHGKYGLRVGPQGDAFVAENRKTRNLERYTARFYIRPDALRIPEGDTVAIFGGWNARGEPQLLLTLRRDRGRFLVFPEVFDNQGHRFRGSATPLVPGWRCLEVFWQASDGAADGVRFWVDEQEQRGLGGVHNAGATIDGIRMGAVHGWKPSMEGSMEFDSFASTRGTPIGCFVKPDELAVPDAGL